MDFELNIPFLSQMENVKLPDPDLLMFYQDLEKRHIWLEDEVSPDSCNYIMKFIQQANRGDDMTPITLHIASNGGDLSTMFAMYYTIKNSKVPVHTINECNCHSAAVTIFLAGAKRSMNLGASFILHEGSAHVAGSHRETKSAMAQYEKDIAKMRALIVENTLFTEEELNAQFEKDQDFYVDFDLATEKGMLK